jgi:FHS family L-fucose permease-like MFS transporter
MASVTPGVTQAELPISGSTGNYRFALSALTSLFFIWGFITCLNDILIPHLKNVFSLNYTQAMLIQFCFFGAYFVMSLPAGALVHRIGYKRGLVVGLLVAGVGCLLFYPAASLQVYSLFLGALFVLASGITLLQVSANPYVTALGPAETASSRLNLTQAFNSLGTTVAPFFGALLILSVVPDAIDHSSQVAAEADAVKLPYMLLAATLFLFAAIFAALKLPSFHDANLPKSTVTAPKISGSAWQYPHLVLGALGIFVYVGAEVSIGSFLVSFLGEADIAGLAEAQAAQYIAWYWGGAMVGRFIGAAVMTRVDPAKVLAFNGAAAVLLVATAALGSGNLAMYAILLVGLCNSIMFPTIFSLALRGLGEHTSQGSGVLCLAIVGGALIPLLQGVLADSMGLQAAFILPVICYLYIVFYGLRGSRVVVTEN